MAGDPRNPDSGVHRRPTAPYSESHPSIPIASPVDEPPPPKKKSLLRKILKGFMIFLLVLIGLIGAALIFFSTGPGKNIVRGLIEGKLAQRYDGDVSLGKLDYSIFGGSLSLGDLDVKDHTGKPALQLGTLAVDMDFLSLLGSTINIDKVLVDHVFVDTAVLKAISKEPFKLPEGDKGIHLADLDVRDVNAHVTRPDGSILDVKGLTIQASADIDKKNNTTRATLNKLALGATITKPDGTVIQVGDVDMNLKADLAGEDAQVDVGKLALAIQLDKPGKDEVAATDTTPAIPAVPKLNVKVPLEATLALVKKGTVVTLLLTPKSTTAVVQRGSDAPLSVPITLPVVSLDIAPDGMMITKADGFAAGPLQIAHIGASGHLPAPGTMALGPGEHTLEATGIKVQGAGVNTLLGRDLLKSDIAMDLSVKGPAEKMVIDGKVVTDGGRFALVGWLDLHDLTNPVYDIKLTGDDIDTTKLLMNPARAVTTKVLLTLKGSGTPMPPPGNLDVAAHLEIGPTEVVLPNGTRKVDMISGDAIVKGTSVRIENAIVTAYGQELRLDAEVDRATRDFRARARVETQISEAVENLRNGGVLIVPLPPIRGNIDIDFEAFGKLKQEGVVAPELAGLSQIIAQKLPVEEITIKGSAKAQDLHVELPAGERAIGKLDATVDVTVRDYQPQGTIKAVINDIDLGTQKIDKVDFQAVLEGLTQHLTLLVDDEKQNLHVDMAATSTIDLDKRSATVVVEKLELQRGAAETKLDAPARLVINQSQEAGGGVQHVTLEPARLLLAGGTLSVSADASLSRDPEKPGASKVDAMTLALDMDGLQIGKLAALAKKPARGLGGTVSGSLRVGGTPAAPSADFGLQVHGRIKSGGPFTLKADGQLRDSKLEAHVAMHDKERTPLMKLDVRAPIAMPKPGSGGKPGLAPGGHLQVDFVLPETKLSRLGKLSPNPLPPAVDPDGTIAAAMHMTGSPARPNATWNLEIDGGFLRRKGYDNAPAQQKVRVDGKLSPEQGLIMLTNHLAVFVDAGGTPTIDHALTGEFKRSPLLAGGMNAGWKLDGQLVPIDLAPLYGWGLAKNKIAGTVTHALALEGKDQDVLGTIDLGFAELQVGSAPVAAGTFHIAIEPTETKIDQLIKVAGQDTLRANIVVGLGGRGLRRTIKDKPRLMASPLSGNVELVERTLADWKKLIEKVPNLPGKVGGKLVLGGTLETPEARGAFAWDGFDTLAGTPGRVALEIDANAATAGSALVIGPNHEVSVGAKVERAALAPSTAALPPPLPIDVLAKADKVDLLKLVPAFVVAGKPIAVKGTLDWNMNGHLLMSRDPDKKGLLPESTLGGDFDLASLDVVVPDTDRHIQDGRMHLSASPAGIVIEGIHAREADMQKDNRLIDVDGKVAFVSWKPDSAKLHIKTSDWLIGGKGFDGPEGELDSDIRIAASDLMGTTKAVDVTIESLDLNDPDRFIRGHYPQAVAYSDIIYTDETHEAAGVLPHVARPPEPPPADAQVAPIDPNAPPVAPPPPLQLDLHIKIPNAIHVSQPIPLDVWLQGGMDVAVRGKDVQLHGKIDVVKGVLGAMGRFFDLEDGSVVADGGLDTLKAELNFGYQPSDIVLREFALPDGTYPKARITVFFTTKTGQKTYFSGIAGNYLLDLTTMLNVGRTRYWGPPDSPASGMVRFGNPDQGLVVTFVQTNLRNLIFMDRFSGWSESLEEPEEYGRLQYYDMQRFVDGGRWRFTAQPIEPGQNRMELGYDWLLQKSARSVVGFGPHFGLDLNLGLGLTWDWSSKN